MGVATAVETTKPKENANTNHKILKPLNSSLQVHSCPSKLTKTADLYLYEHMLVNIQKSMIFK